MSWKRWYWALPVLGTLFCLWYIRTAACDVIYTDYIRLVNSYLPDVWNPGKFFVPDVLTRIPVNYAARIVNTSLLDFRTTFDMALGALGLGASGLCIARYAKNRAIGPVWFVMAMVVLFSLNKWEMLTNGSGWAHFLAFGCFYYHYLVLDRVWAGEEKRYDHIRLLILPSLITLGVAGPYCAVYTGVLVLAYGYRIIETRAETGKWDKRFLSYLAAVLLPFLLYLWSNSFAVEDHAGAVSVPVLSVLAKTPSFFARFLLKALSTVILGKETAEAVIGGRNAVFFALGALALAAYGLAFYLNVRFKIYKKTIFPLILMVSGLMNHLIVLVSRWIFLNENYGMSSRYELQYQAGILGMIMTFAFVWRELRGRRKAAARAAAAAFCALVLLGNIYTTWDEIRKAPHREENFERMAAVALNFEQESDDTLRETFGYRTEEQGSGQKVRAALTILRDQQWSVFRARKGS